LIAIDVDNVVTAARLAGIIIILMSSPHELAPYFTQGYHFKGTRPKNRDSGGEKESETRLWIRKIVFSTFLQYNFYLLYQLYLLKTIILNKFEALN